MYIKKTITTTFRLFTFCDIPFRFKFVGWPLTMTQIDLLDLNMTSFKKATV